MEENPKQAKNLFKQLINDGKSEFYATDKINKTFLNKAKISVYEKDCVFYKDRRQNIPFYTPFIEQKKHIDWSSALYTIKALFELLHADVADIHFFQI